MARRQNNYATRLDGASNASFFPIKKSCPICNQWLDCLTTVHCAKHGLTRAQFMERYCKPEVSEDINLCAIPPSEAGETLIDMLKRTLKDNPEAWVSPKMVSTTLGAPLESVRRTLARIERTGYAIHRFVKMAPRTAFDGTSLPKTEKMYAFNPEYEEIDTNREEVTA